MGADHWRQCVAAEKIRKEQGTAVERASKNDNEQGHVDGTQREADGAEGEPGEFAPEVGESAGSEGEWKHGGSGGAGAGIRGHIRSSSTGAREATGPGPGGAFRG